MLATAHNLTALLSLCCETLTLSQHLAVIVQNITVAANQEQRHIHTIIYVSQEDTVGLSQVQTDTLLARFHEHNSRPVLKYNAAPPYRRFWDNFNNNYLVVAQLDGQSQFDEHLLAVLWQRAWQNTQSRLILLLDDAVNATYVAELLQYCAAHQAMKVIAMRPTEAMQEKIYWTLKLFPKLLVVRRRFSPHYKATFPQHLGNMHAHPLRIATTINYPWLSGKIFVEYARRHNATLLYPLGEAKDALFLDRLDDVVQNGSADMSCLQSYENPFRNLSYSRISGIQCAHFAGLARSDIWMESRTLAARSAIYVGISVAGIIFSTTYGTYLQSFNMRAPTSAPVENIPDLVARGTKVLIHADEMKLLHLDVGQFLGIRPYLSYMTVFEKLSEISQLRSAFDTRYAYFISIVVSFSENSVHRWALNELLGDLKAAGLLEFWKRHAFVEMLQLKQITLKDRNRKTGDFEPMKLEALSIVLSALAVLEMLAVMCFFIELCWAKCRRLFNAHSAFI
ncbi:unnamed protein product [Ceratitis capitata]|uniref:(Mediterranean fruit fly) hypothetical protein n=1 Tax=Ceratitis capitata TaxID=7213 RepID=A0A811TXI8_CERCA|nr:unnamed protein product [Ceratitis capitata]